MVWSLVFWLSGKFNTEGDFLTFWNRCLLSVREQSAGRAVNWAFKHSFKLHTVKYWQGKGLNESISIFMLGMVPLSFL